MQAFRHHKAVAVLALTDPEVRERCGSLEPLVQRRQFQGALTLRQARLLGRCVDVSRQLAIRVEALLLQNLRFLVERYEVRSHGFCQGEIGVEDGWWGCCVSSGAQEGMVTSAHTTCAIEGKARK